MAPLWASIASRVRLSNVLCCSAVAAGQLFARAGAAAVVEAMKHEHELKKIKTRQGARVGPALSRYFESSDLFSNVYASREELRQISRDTSMRRAVRNESGTLPDKTSGVGISDLCCFLREITYRTRTVT